MQTETSRVPIVDAGRLLAWCDIVPSTVRGSRDAAVRLEVVRGHLPSGTRSKLVDDLADRARDAGLDRLHIAVALGDELIDLLQRRGHRHAEMRAAGSTCLIEVDVACLTGRCTHPPL